MSSVKNCFSGKLSEQVAWLFVTEQFASVVDKQDLLDFVTYEKDPERIKALATRLCKNLEEEVPPDDRTFFEDASLAPGINTSSTRLARRLNSKRQTPSVRLASKVVSDVKGNNSLLLSLHQETDSARLLHTLTESKLLTPKEAASVDDNFHSALQGSIVKTLFPSVGELVRQIVDTDVQEKVHVALTSSYTLTSLKVLVSFLEQCSSKWRRVLRYVKYNLTDWYKYFGKKKQPRCSDNWEKDVQTIQKIIRELERRGLRV